MVEVKSVMVNAGVSGGAAWTAWFSATLPVVQWLAAFVAILSGAVAISLGVTKLCQMWSKRHT